MSDQSGAGGGENAPTPEAPEQQGSEPPEWLGPINERMAELRDQQASIAERLEQSAYPEYEAEEEEESLDEDDYYDEDGEYTEEGARRLLSGLVDERLGAELSKRDAARALDEREDAFDALRDEVPALQDDKLAAQLVRDTAAWCQQNGLERVIDTPAFVDLIEDRYYSGQFHERIAAERESDPDREVVLESAGGAGAPPKSKEPDWGERIVKAAERLRPQI
jgi:hypothetical protein